MLALPPGSSASEWILQVTRRSPEPDTSICLPHSPLLILSLHVLAKDTETVHLIPSTSAPSSARQQAQILTWAGVRCPAQFGLPHQVVTVLLARWAPG